MSCPPDDELVEYIEQLLEPSRRIELEEHLRGCASCREAVALARGLSATGVTDREAPSLLGDRASEPAALFGAGGRLGRYTVLELIGMGGMGAVFAARDPELQRRVAVKIQLSSAGGPDDQDRRFLAEARAMATVSHPNVIAVHDVGTDDGVPFFAMEYVEGGTLKAWLAQGRSVAEILRVFIAAGEGLAAAHAQGLVHRDFKPANVLVDTQGRARVIDFGLVRFADGSGGRETGQAAADVGASPSTRTGTLMGTPAYMAPEQLQGGSADAASDQFAFCVALYEALYGTRPFGGKTIAALFAAISSATLEAPVTSRRVPRRVRRAILRGLSLDAKARFGSMRLLLQRLAPGARRGRVVVGTTLAAGVAAIPWLDGGTDLCSGAEQQLGPVWSREASGQVRDTIVGAGREFEATWVFVRDRVDAYTDDWQDAYVEACRATVRGEQSNQLLDRRMACLNGAKAHLGATVRLLAAGDAAVVDRVDRLMAGLPELERCAATEELRAVQPPSASEAQAVARAREELAEANVQRRADHLETAANRLEAAQALLDGVSYEPVRTELWLERSRLEVDREAFDEALESLAMAEQLAARSGQWSELAEAHLDRIYVLGFSKADVDNARAFLPVTRGLVGRTGRFEAKLLGVEAGLLRLKGEYAEATEIYRQALQLESEAGAWTELNTASMRSSLGLALYGLGRFEEALTEHRGALSVVEGALGPSHALAAIYHNRIGGTLNDLGRFEEAQAALRRSVEISLARGGDGLRVAYAMNNLAAVCMKVGELDEAQAHAKAALAIFERDFGASDPRLATVLGLLGTIARSGGDPAEAEGYLRRSIEILDAAGRGEHPNTEAMRTNLAVALLAQGRAVAAEALIREVLERTRKSLGEDHASVAFDRYTLAQALEVQQRHADAADELRAAVRIYAASVGDEHPEMCRAKISLGKQLVALGQFADARREALDAMAMDQSVCPTRGWAKAVLARCRWQEGSEAARSEAKKLAGEALAAVADDAAEREGLARWLGPEFAAQRE